MAVPDGYTDVFYGISVAGDTELMGITMAWDTGGGTPSEEACEGHYNRMITLFKPRVNSNYSFPVARFSTGTPAGDFTQEVAPTVTAIGTGATTPLPNNCALLVAKITSLGGRRNRGRFYFPGVTEGNVNEAGVLTAGERTAWQTIMDSWVTGELSAGWGIPVLLHQTGPSTPTVINNLVVRPKIATQRRRMRP